MLGPTWLVPCFPYLQLLHLLLKLKPPQFCRKPPLKVLPHQARSERPGTGRRGGLLNIAQFPKTLGSVCIAFRHSAPFGLLALLPPTCSTKVSCFTSSAAAGLLCGSGSQHCIQGAGYRRTMKAHPGCHPGGRAGHRCTRHPLSGHQGTQPSHWSAVSHVIRCPCQGALYKPVSPPSR